MWYLCFIYGSVDQTSNHLQHKYVVISWELLGNEEPVLLKSYSPDRSTRLHIWSHIEEHMEVFKKVNKIIFTSKIKI